MCSLIKSDLYFFTLSIPPHIFYLLLQCYINIEISVDLICIVLTTVFYLSLINQEKVGLQCGGKVCYDQ